MSAWKQTIVNQWLTTGLTMTIRLTCAIKLGNITTLLGAKMDKEISAAEANQRFSKLLREVKEGSRFVVTSHGRPVAQVIPVAKGNLSRERAKAVLMKRLRSQKVVEVGRWKREELYE
jgi:prevent-host-death family protein